MIELRQATDYPGQQAEEELVYVDDDGVPFADLFVRPDNCTLAWPGALSFESVAQEALQTIPHLTRLHPIERLGQPDPADAHARVVFLSETGLHEFNLLTRDDFVGYRRLLHQHGEGIQFARFDVTTAAPDTAETVGYALTTSMRDTAGGIAGETTLTLPRTMPWSPEVLRWVVQHHRDIAPGGSKVETRSNGLIEALVVNIARVLLDRLERESSESTQSGEDIDNLPHDA